MKETTFALFVGILGSYWVGETRNYNQVSFANTYADVLCIACIRWFKVHTRIQKWNFKLESILEKHVYKLNLAQKSRDIFLNNNFKKKR
jgi:hypothetical protein